MSKLQQIGWHELIRRAFPEFSGANKRDRRFQFRGHRVEIKLRAVSRHLPIHLTIRTVKVTLLVCSRFDAHRQSTRSRRDGDVNKSIAKKIARTTECRAGVASQTG